MLAPLLGLPKSIFYKIVVTHQAEKNLDVRPYKVLLLTCVVNYIAGTANATALSSGQCTRLRVG